MTDQFFDTKNSRNSSKQKIEQKGKPKRPPTQILTPEPNQSFIRRKTSGNDFSNSQGKLSFIENGAHRPSTRKQSVVKGAHAATMLEIDKARNRSSSEVFKEAARLRQSQACNQVYYKLSGKKNPDSEKESVGRNSSASDSQTQMSLKPSSNYQKSRNMFIGASNLRERKEEESVRKISTSKNVANGFSANIFGRRLYTEKMANENVLGLKRKWKKPTSNTLVENSKSKSVSTVAPERGSWKSTKPAKLEDESTMVRLAVHEDLRQTKGLINRLKTLHVENEAIKGLIGASIGRIPVMQAQARVRRENLGSLDVDLEQQYRELILKTTQLYKEMFQQA